MKESIRALLFAVKDGRVSVDEAFKTIETLNKAVASAATRNPETWRDACPSCGLPEVLPDVRFCPRCGEER